MKFLKKKDKAREETVTASGSSQFEKGMMSIFSPWISAMID